MKWKEWRYYRLHKQIKKDLKLIGFLKKRIIKCRKKVIDIENTSVLILYK